MLLALHAYRNEMKTPRALAKESIKIEQVILNESVGIQDQILTSFGGLNVLRVGPDKDFRVDPLLLPKEYKKSFEDHIMLAFTGFQRSASEQAKTQIDNIKNGTTKSQLIEINSIAEEALNVFSKQKEISEIGRLLDHTWRLKRSLSDSVTNQQIDEIYDAAISAGAYGGKLLGAGGGGFMMFLAPPEKHEYIKNKISKLKIWVPFSFENSGAQIVFHAED